MRDKPALLLLLAPLVSFCCFRIVPLLFKMEPVNLNDVCLSATHAFVPFDEIFKFNPYSASSVAAAAVAAMQNFLQLVLHAYYYSSSSAVVWLLVAPLVLYSAALLLQEAEQQQRRPRGSNSSPMWPRFAVQQLLLLPLLSGLLLVCLLYFCDYEDVCISGFLPFLLSVNFLAFAADPVSFLSGCC